MLRKGELAFSRDQSFIGYLRPHIWTTLNGFCMLYSNICVTILKVEVVYLRMSGANTGGVREKFYTQP